MSGCVLSSPPQEETTVLPDDQATLLPDEMKEQDETDKMFNLRSGSTEENQDLNLRKYFSL